MCLVLYYRGTSLLLVPWLEHSGREGGREIQGEISLPPPWDGFFGGTEEEEEEEEAPTKGCKLFMREERRRRRNRDGRGPPTTFSFSFLVWK